MSQTLKVNGPGTVTIGDMFFTADIPPINHAPIVSIDPIAPITLPATSIKLTGHASDPDTGGKISMVLWEIVSGVGSFDDIHSYTPTISNLGQGTTTVKFTAIDDQGAASFAQGNIIVSAVQPPNPPAGYTLIYKNDISSVNDCDPFGKGQFGTSPLSKHYDTSAFVSPPGSFRSLPANVSSGIRSEIQLDDSLSPVEGALEWAMRINNPIWQNGHCLQKHPRTTGGSASPGLWFVGNGKWDWHNWIAGVNQSHPVNYKVDVGVWHNHRIEWLDGKSGYFNHYIDGILVCSWKGQVGDNSGYWLKIGYNGWDSNSVNSDISYDNIALYKKG